MKAGVGKSSAEFGWGLQQSLVVSLSYREMGSTQGKSGFKKVQEEEKYFTFKEMIKKCAVSDPQLHYKFGERIGEGSYAEVFKVQSLSTGELRVIKKVLKSSSPNLGRNLFNEFDILREMDHPNIVKMYEMFEDEKYHYIVTEYVPGRDALDLLTALETVGEDMAFSMVHQCLLALNYLNKNKVMHRDVKLENIIYNDETMCFKLIDFGSALRYSSCAPKERRTTGTINYMAPEVLNQYYNMNCDVWSLGVLLFVLMSGNAPFVGNSHEEIIQKTLKQPLKFSKPIWETRSPEVKHLLTRMLDKNFQKRPKVSELLKDPWILKHKLAKKVAKSETEGTCLCLQRLLKFRKITFTDIQLGILLFMINFVIKIDNQIIMIRSFLRIDQLGDGEIDPNEMKQALVDLLGMEGKVAEVAGREVIEKIDLNRSNGISFSEFVLGATDLRKVITHQNIMKTFRYIDTDDSKKISMAELKARLGDHLDEVQYQRLVGLFDSDNDGEIDEHEFSNMMTDLLKQY